MKARIVALLLCLCACVAPFLPPSLVPPAGAAQVSPQAESEIKHLLSYIEHSGCQFYRNGVWYEDTKAVRDHVTKKYHYFVQKGQIASAEDFITWCATKSEMSGKPYLVKSRTKSPLPLAEWLHEELARYRKNT